MYLDDDQTSDLNELNMEESDEISKRHNFALRVSK